MGRFRVNRFLYSIIPLSVVIIMLTYIFILFRKSYMVSNVINLVLDGIILLYYLLTFCTEVRVDSDGARFYTIFKNYRVSREDIKYARQSSFLTKFFTKNRNFYILTTPNGRYILQEMFKSFRR